MKGGNTDFFFFKINLKQELEKNQGGCVLTLPDGLQAMLERPCVGIHLQF